MSDCPLYNSIGDMFLSLYQNAVLSSLKSFSSLDHPVDNSLHLIETTPICSLRESTSLTPSRCTSSPIYLLTSWTSETKLHCLSFRMLRARLIRGLGNHFRHQIVWKEGPPIYIHRTLVGLYDPPILGSRRRQSLNVLGL